MIILVIILGMVASLLILKVAANHNTIRVLQESSDAAWEDAQLHEAALVHAITEMYPFSGKALIEKLNEYKSWAEKSLKEDTPTWIPASSTVEHA